MVNPSLATTAVGVVEPQRSGMASGINSTFRQVGIATGIAAWGAILAGVIERHASDFAAAVGVRAPAGGDFSDFITFGAYERLGPQAVEAGRAAFLDGLNEILLIAGLVALVCGVLTFLLIRRQDFVAHG